MIADMNGNPRDTERLCLSRAEACRTLGLSLSNVKALISRGELREIRVGRRSLIPRTELERFISVRATS